jgi:hypothetical protein
MHVIAADGSLHIQTAHPKRKCNRPLKGPSKRVRLCVQIGVRFCAPIADKEFRVLIIVQTPIKAACQHISGKIS